MIFGNDNRIVIPSNSTNLYSYAPAVQIISRFSDGYLAQGSGTMVGINDVLTAAHVLYSPQHGGYATGIEVTPLRLGALKPFGVVYATDMIVSSRWIDSGNYEGDYGLITLARPIGYQCGWIDIGSVNAYTLLGKEVYSYGYPGDLDSGDQLYGVSGSVDSTAGNILQFLDDLDARGGQSGSGIFTNTDDGFKVLGVISYESRVPDYNAAVTFNTLIASEIQGWIGANDTGVPARLDADNSLRPIIEEINLMVIAFLQRNGTKSELDILSNAYTQGSDWSKIGQIIYGWDVYNATPAAGMNNSAFLEHVFSTVL